MLKIKEENRGIPVSSLDGNDVGKIGFFRDRLCFVFYDGRESEIRLVRLDGKDTFSDLHQMQGDFVEVDKGITFVYK